MTQFIPLKLLKVLLPHSGFVQRLITTAKALRCWRYRRLAGLTNTFMFLILRSQNLVRFAAGGFGYFFSVSLYCSTAFSAGAVVQLKSPVTSRSSCGSISMLKAFGYPAIGPLAERRPTWRCGPIPVG